MPYVFGIGSVEIGHCYLLRHSGSTARLAGFASFAVDTEINLYQLPIHHIYFHSFQRVCVT
jgi:hypothetical protein